MLFPYTYVPHQMERMQRFVNFIFYQIWCCAPKSGQFNLNLFDANPPLKEVLTDIYYKDGKTGDQFLGQIQLIYECFSQLKRSEIVQLKRWYQGNNNLQAVCSKYPRVQLARYNDIAAIDQDLASQLYSFFKELYSTSLLGLAALRDKIGNLGDHYKKFMKVNSSGKCPFCGIADLLGVDHSRREAYDHYFPKSIYPFNSINFRNLVPACHTCNSSYKLSKDPAYSGTAGQRRAIFYPYTKIPYFIELKITFQHTDIHKLTKIDINIDFGPDELAEEIKTWNDLYGIEERYKSKLLEENEGKYWLVQILDEWQEDGRPPADYLRTLARQTKKRPYAECNFLKKPFLDACQQMGLFDDINIEQTNTL